MDWYFAALLLIGGLLFLMLFGFPVAVAFLLINLIGVVIFMGGLPGIEQLVANATSSVTNFALVPVPLFLIMGELLFHSGLAFRVFNALDKLLGGIPGRLAYLTVGGGTIFATLSGSSMANTAMLGTTLMPDMIKRGYKPYIIMGPILATGGLAMIIPPSSLAVLLGSLARLDVGALLIAGLLPGLILALFYVVIIALTIRIDPDAAPAYAAQRHRFGEIVLAMIRDVLPMGFVVFAVVGMILLGWASPTIRGLRRAGCRHPGRRQPLHDLGGADQVPDGNAAGFGNDAIHHSGLDHLLADPGLFGGVTRHGQFRHGFRSGAAGDASGHADRFDRAGNVHGSAFDHDAVPADFHAHRAALRV